MLEGGGVKGIGLVGAIKVFGDAGYRFRRVAGTSAGAIVGSLAAPASGGIGSPGVGFHPWQDPQVVSDARGGSGCGEFW